ncbi:MAG TPA: TlpA family protein disulfide reductase [Polyangiaceae bacterium]|nr:TlpA family protein disulfide reductase [Polyangiaceae bacterium]
MPSPRPPETPWFTAGLVLFAAGLFGWLVLPRLAPDPFIGKPAPDFLLAKLGPSGAVSPDKVRLSDLEGKAVILDFWASWCMPCRAEMPVIDRVAKAQRARGLVALGVLSGDLPEDAAEFLAEHPVSYGSVIDDQSVAGHAFGVQGLPTLVVLDKKGKVVAMRTGTVPENELSALAEAALR